MTHLRLTHPDIDFWIDVRLREFDGRWLAVADLADTPDVGGDTAEGALRGAMSSLREGLAVFLRLEHLSDHHCRTLGRPKRQTDPVSRCRITI